MPRFVLLYHDCPPNYERASHWDFMLESGDVLRTWALERLPRNWQAAHSRTSVVYSNCPLLAEDNLVTAMPLGDHRRDYLEIEGPLSGDRGTVIRVATGTYRSEQEAPGEWRVALMCEDLPESACLSGNETDRHWTMTTQYQVPSTES
jgi:hypothetical protein